MTQDAVSSGLAIDRRRGIQLPPLDWLIRFARKKPAGAVALGVVIAVILIAVFAPLVSRYDPNYVFAEPNLN
ncbi:MAG: hypothetical protein O3A10_14915 [Chloroflexi bacterium]|nr:hypothetical protein [Chloroflexota bacterium]MDA1146680.1 hypothetical protein [Chloroflexota bacterium]